MLQPSPSILFILAHRLQQRLACKTILVRTPGSPSTLLALFRKVQAGAGALDTSSANPLATHCRDLRAAILRATMSSATRLPTAFSTAHRQYVMSLYRRYLRTSLDWCIRRDVWRNRAIEIRAEFERNRNIRNPRELARVLQEAEENLKRISHPDPYRPAMFEDGTKWCVSLQLAKWLSEVLIFLTLYTLPLIGSLSLRSIMLLGRGTCQCVHTLTFRCLIKLRVVRRC
ncbi:hypothetical protein K437DRAFT_225447 [Tilletiaria anomala UBC 951]|uniref:NADH dehydrogenase [ubiquinone] 1 beta subcomplex subunit 9 n=1 Tax=Tilletiaria anomala (strain ATCC 24038 / CBS 436.72 / UBC 951) TaxID=1037660 RepID=A0A066VQM5_TILAU|nr:uncharacterized protein K437DRAFT_225447 [Tilletiaria anomala UBC 951]KDN43766.1 hypothetical protein K437DRAFT_225447 [Tilletiaria anomala UBC 951]